MASGANDDIDPPSSPVCYAAEVNPDYSWAPGGVDHVRLKRVYDPVAGDDGRRILVDRMWPRGVRKADARLDAWLRELAPSHALRKWFGHDPARFPEFAQRYRAELAQRPEALQELIEAAQAGRVTLVFSARDRERNQAVVLRQVVAERLASQTP